MKVYSLTIRGISPLLQSRVYEHEVPRLAKETHNDYEQRTWQHKAHSDKDGKVIIPAIFMRNCLREAAQYLGIQIPGKGKSTYTKHFNSGIGIYDDAQLSVKVTDTKKFTMLANADGRHGSGKRVVRLFPKIDEWQAMFKIYVMDETITREVLLQHASEGGMFRGIGTRRPGNGGEFGRFKVEELKEVKA